MTYIKTFVAALALVVMSAFVATPARAEVDPDMRPALEEALNSTVHIQARGAVDNDGNYRNWTGTGYVVAVEDDRVVIATNCHVACNAVFVWVTSYDGSVRRVRADFITGDDDQDIAFISLDRDEFRSARALPLLAGNPERGEATIALGGPLGLRFTVTEGIMSYPNRKDTGYPTRDGVHQTDAAVNPGNSGGPLVVERNGRYVVAGMNTFIVTRTGLNIGLGFAVPSTDIQRALNSVLADETPVRNTVGVSVTEVENAELLGVTRFYLRQNVSGAYIAAVDPEGVAAAAGLQGGDIIVEVGTTLIRSPDDVITAVQTARQDRPLRIRYIRDNGQKQVYVVPSNAWGSELRDGVVASLTEAADNNAAPTSPVQSLLGMNLANPASPAYLQQFAPMLTFTGYQMINSPVVVGLTNGGKAHEAGATVGQFVVGVQFPGMRAMPVRSEEELAAVIATAREANPNLNIMALHTRKLVQTSETTVQVVSAVLYITLD